ncbi:MAG: hypothetical protein BWZ10_01096 [candidate division BRC1 bacterium ADurb.BinA364]|nr:MAG: hypothetical protein BWZ10_01096 [candidate division BRC1 bacterium ADurb.BinA364]
MNRGGVGRRLGQTLDLGQHLQAALNAGGLVGLIAEAVDELLGPLDLALLVLEGALLDDAPLVALLQVVRIASPIHRQAPAVYLEDAVGQAVHEGALVRNQHDGRTRRANPVLEPEHGLQVQMVRRLVQQQHVGIVEQQFRQRDAVAPASREFAAGALQVGGGESQAGGRLGGPGFDFVGPQALEFALDEIVAVGDAQEPLLVHRLGDFVLQFARFGHSLAGFLKGRKQFLEQRRIRFDPRLLFQIADAGALGHGNIAGVGRHQRADYAQERAFPRAVRADHGDFFAFRSEKGDIVQDDAAAQHAGDVVNGEHNAAGGGLALGPFGFALGRETSKEGDLAQGCPPCQRARKEKAHAREHGFAFPGVLDIQSVARYAAGDARNAPG